MHVDQYQRVYRSDGNWLKRENFPIKIPIREQFDDAYQTVYFNKREILEKDLDNWNISMMGDNFFANEIPPSSELGVICEYVGMSRINIESLNFCNKFLFVLRFIINSLNFL